MLIYAGTPVPLAFPGTSADELGTPPVLTVTQPDLTTATPEVTWDPGTSEYTAAGPSAQPGHYLVAWATSDATFPGGYGDSYNVTSLATTSILSLSEAKRSLRIPVTDTSEDDFIAEFNPVATAIIEWYCGPVIQRAVTERLPAGGLVVQLSLPPLLSLTPWTTIPATLADAGIAVPDPPSPMFPTRVFGVSYPTEQLYPDPVLGTVTHTSGLPFYYGEYIWSYQAGRPVIPDCILYGARALLRHLYGLERGGTTGSGGSGSIAAGDEETTQTPMGFAVPNRVLEAMISEQLPAAIA